jgi:hypothetical protein
LPQDNEKRGTMRKMNVLARRLVMLFLPVVAAVSLAAPASAASSTPTRWVTVGADGSVSVADTGSPVAPLQLRSYISNENASGLGVSKDYVDGPYQAILPGNRRTDGTPLYWSRAVSFYVGVGYCADAWFYQGGWKFTRTWAGPVEVLTPQTIPGEAVARWAIRNIRIC